MLMMKRLKNYDDKVKEKRVRMAFIMLVQKLAVGHWSDQGTFTFTFFLKVNIFQQFFIEIEKEIHRKSIFFHS